MTRRRGFTLLELTVALLVTGVVLLGARLLADQIGRASERLRLMAGEANTRVNGERLLRDVFDQVEVGTDSAGWFAGDESVVRLTTWCASPGGWPGRRRARVVVRASAESSRVVLFLSTSESIVVRRTSGRAMLRYLNDQPDGERWLHFWTKGLTAPRAMGIVTDRDTMIVRIGERG